ncbi:MAG: energy-coupling factor ABC transporter ATP-binding protein [Spirochaetaceae bacterium]|jgi:cobalt/nickel transport system ATP-binding protein|nr:energy-coupling factor ABC transporter ATP-binding protein [Spirochaetaceae bacterium]
MGAIVSVRGLSAVYPGSGEASVLNALDFSIEQGERVALIGANGAGKSTLLLTLAGVLPAFSGEIVVNGRRVDKANLAALRRDAALVFQNPDDQLFMSTLWEDVLFGPINYLARECRSRAELAARRPGIEQEARALLEALGIAHLKDKMPHKLSGGEKRRAALAAVLIMKPALLLLDEPSAFLDPRARRALVALLAGLPQTQLVATHDLDMAQALCPRTMLLSGGCLLASAPTSEILANGPLLEAAGL